METPKPKIGPSDEWMDKVAEEVGTGDREAARQHFAPRPKPEVELHAVRQQRLDAATAFLMTNEVMANLV